ncbi:MAG TPA: hypothetical protein VF285_11910 [Castellaniella sp.]|uniref:hypothetical protein n=1 Tax=Castellaniella sp. TaxID=1955812 RepID=UPI002F05A77C
MGEGEVTPETSIDSPPSGGGALLAAAVLALAGHDGLAVAIAITNVGAVITGFLNGRRTAKDSVATDIKEPVQGAASNEGRQ